MTRSVERVCPVELAGGLDSRIRRWVQNPRRILGPYVKEGMSAVDLGCGPGFFTVDLARLVGESGRVIAADLQEGMLEKLHRKIQRTALEGRITLHRCEPNRIGLPAGVDFVLAFYVVHEFPDAGALFGEVRAVLAPNGRMLVVEPPFHVSRKAFADMVQKAQKAGLTPTGRPRVPLSKTVILERTQPCRSRDSIRTRPT